MISLMKAKLDASRSLLYETTRFVDMYKAYEDIAKERSLEPEERAEMKAYQNCPTHSPLWRKACPANSVIKTPMTACKYTEGPVS